MKIIHKYIFMEILKIFVISVSFLTLILLLEQTLYMTEMIANRGVTFIEGLRLMVYTSPIFLLLSIPLSLLIATVSTFNQFSGDNEFVAMKTSGWSFTFLARPIMAFSIAAYILTNVVVFFAIPWGNQEFKKTLFDIVKNRAHINIQPKIFNSDFKDLVLYAQSKDGETLLKDIFVADQSEQGANKIILAKQGVIVSDPETYQITLQFQNGTIHDMTKEGRNYNILNFDRYERLLKLPDNQNLLSKLVERNRDISYGELKEIIQKKRAQGQETAREEVQVSKKFAIPFSCLLFGIAGATLGIKSSRSGRSGGIIVSALVLGVYYIGMIFSQNVGKHNLVNPSLAMWMPNVALFFLTYFMVWKTVKENSFTWLTRFSDALYTAFDALRDVYTGLRKKLTPLKSSKKEPPIRWERTPREMEREVEKVS